MHGSSYYYDYLYCCKLIGIKHTIGYIMRFIHRRGLFITSFVFLLSVMCGCTQSKIYRIGVSQCSLDDWRMKMNREIENEIMFHEDAMVEIRSADDNNEKQISDIRYFADNGFDIIIVAPNEAAALTPAIKEIYERGIPVIIFDRYIIGDCYTARIGVDNEGLGLSAARYALHLKGKGAKAIEIYGLPGSSPADGRHKGFYEEFISGGGNLVATVNGNWNKEDAIPAIDSLLRIHSDIDLIYAHNDRMAIGASETAKKLGRNEIKIIGIDAAPHIGIQAVADGIIDATFLYPTEGYRLIRTALQILKNEPYERETVLPVSSAVDRTNADILLLMNETMEEETGKMRLIKSQIDDYWVKHTTQTTLFYACIAIIILMAGVIFLVLREYWQHRKYQKELLRQNEVLEEQKNVQQQLNERLKEALQSKLAFFTNVSHDLRTPLTLIAEPVSQLAEAPNITSRQQTLVRLADKNLRILRRLIDQILDFRKYENNRLQLNLSEIDLGKAIEDWAGSFYELARKRSLKLTVSPMPGYVYTTVAVDAEKIERIFFNLISNAFKYTPDGGGVNVSYGVDLEGMFTISVADTGKGISERDIGNIFDRFYQVEHIHPNGSGIGLSLCKAFAELHGGSIKVESTLKKGSVFVVHLPVRHTGERIEEVNKLIKSQDVEAELGTVEAEVTIDENKPVVLVIDDNKDIQVLITELMRDTYNIIAASNGSEGVRKAVRYVPDLIICDVMMPVMDGLECCRKLKDEVITSHIPVLMLTACSMEAQRIQGYDSGADGYLSKPFGSEVLLSRCKSLIENRKRIKELWLKDAKGEAGPAKHAETIKNANDIDNDFYNRFLDIFKETMGNSELGIDDIASRMGLERTQFYRKIKSLTNFAPVELMRKLRLKYGRYLIKTTDKNMSEIAYEIGFSSPAYFTRCYRESYGETPTETKNRLYT